MKKEELRKTEAIKYIKEAYSLICTQCETFNCEHKDHFELYSYENKDKNFNKACKIVKCLLLAFEKLTGKPWQEVSK